MKALSCFVLSVIGIVVLGIVVLDGASALATGPRESVFWHNQIQWGASQAEARRILAADQNLTVSCFRLNPAALPDSTGCLVKYREPAPEELTDEAFLMFYQDRFFRYELVFSNYRFFSIVDSAERQLGGPARSTSFAVEGTRGKYTTHVKVWEPRGLRVFMLSHMRSNITKGQLAVTNLSIADTIPNLDPREPIEKEFPHLFAPGLDSFRSPPF